MQFFFGLVLPTLLGKNPNSLSRLRIVSEVGKSSEVYPFCSISSTLTFAALRRVSNQFVLN
jgi:hypothetical protein